jgi:GlpG protein
LPPLQAVERYPVTAGVGLTALALSLIWWTGTDLSLLLEDWTVGHGQPWRLVTSTLLHINLIHLAFNLYWLWVFGTLVEDALGSRATGGIFLLFAVSSSAVEYALFEGGVGLSGVAYGLFGMVWVLARSDARFAGVIDRQTVAAFVAWFVLCCGLTATGVWKVGNAAHAAGAVFGVLLALTMRARARKRLVLGSLFTAMLALVLLAAVFGRLYVNVAGQAAPELAQQGYLDLEHDRNEAAAERYQEALDRDSGQADWWYNLAIAHQRLGETDRAIHAYQRAYDLRPSDKACRSALAELKAYLAYQRLVAGAPEEAIRLYREALALDESNAEWWYNLGLAYQGRGDLEGARESYRRAVALEPTDEAYRTALDSLP